MRRQVLVHLFFERKRGASLCKIGTGLGHLGDRIGIAPSTDGLPGTGQQHADKHDGENAFATRIRHVFKREIVIGMHSDLRAEYQKRILRLNVETILKLTLNKSCVLDA